ncbi:hypothetical protein FO519_007667 [Halicephalobus sp. NKZ332]|nr:hypothetical protein FO519_007667 [Halicephalobus sp. NKZ332]
MEETEDNPKCCSCFPLMPSLKIISLFLAILHFIGLILFSFFGFYSIGLFPFAVLSLIMFIVSFLYWKGLRKENDFLMIPFLVAEILLRVICGFILCFLWGTFILASFNMIVIESPIENTTGPQLFFFIAMFSTIFYGLFVKFFFPFYRGYNIIRKINNRRRMIAEESQYMKICFTSRPTML